VLAFTSVPLLVVLAATGAWLAMRRRRRSADEMKVQR
jgi:hypothetical protein